MRQYIHLARGWLQRVPSFIFAILASKHGGQLLNEVFIDSKHITPSPGYLRGWRIFKLTAVVHGPKLFSRTQFGAFKKS